MSTERPTPETDAVFDKGQLCGGANLDFARKLERQRDEATFGSALSKDTIDRILVALRAAEEMCKELESMACQHICGCGHPACNRCGDAAAARKALAAWKKATE